MFSPDQWLASTGVSFYNGVATQSLRFDIASTSYLKRTPSSASNRKTYTLSFWLKPSSDTLNSSFLVGRTGSGGTYTNLCFSASDNRIRVVDNQTSYPTLETSGKYRDVSAWYHILFAIDTTQGTASNRVKIYVNGEEQSYASSNYYSQNADTNINSTDDHYIGYQAGVANLSGYLAEYNFIDGTQLTPSSFGETKNGVWIPIEYTGSYGTNGYRLQFNQTGTGTASASTIGADTSGNNNHFTSSGIVASDCSLLDSPENNWCTLNSVAKSANVTLSEGNLAFSCSATNKASSSTFGVSSGKWYWEIRSTSSTGGSSIVGIVGNSFTNENFFAGNADGYGYSATALKYNNGSGSSYGATWTNGDIIGVALDLDAGTLTFYKNNSSQGTAYSSISGTFNPILSGQSGTTYVVNFGQDDTFAGAISSAGNTDGNGKGVFKYAPPSGFLALCTSNLPEPTISPNADTQADDYFNTVLWNGNSSTQSITGVGFQPDWLWIKNRTSGSFGHSLTDSSRGANEVLLSESTDDEFTNANNVNAFTSDGFNLGNTSFSGYSNQSGSSYVGWNWKANGGTTSSNTDGSITSTVQANTTAGFSIVTYTGNGSAGATIGHSLGANPAMIIVKGRTNVGVWAVYRGDLGGTERLLLNLTSSVSSDVEYWNNTNATSSVFTVRANSANNGSGQDYVAYCWSEIEGFSKFGSYTGNGSVDGTFVHLGFRPAWILMKRTNSTGNWHVVDNRRVGYNPSNNLLFPDGADAEIAVTDNDILSNGFKLRTTGAGRNASGSTYIYMAFAENPFKYANAR